MKKIIYLFLLCFSLYSLGQSKNNALSESNGNTMLYGVTSLSSNCSVLLGVDEKTKWVSFNNPEPGDPLKNNVFLGQSSRIKLEIRIRKDSLKFYRYTIIENDSVYLADEVTPSKVDFVWPKESDLPGYLTMNLGEYDVVGKKITLKIYRLPQKFKVSTVVIYNKPLLPVKILSKHILSQSINTKDLSTPEIIELVKKKGRKSIFVKNQLLKERDTIVANDLLKNMRIEIENTGVNFIYEVKITRYGSDYPEESVLTTNDWRDSKMFIDADYFRKPGVYWITVSPGIYRSLDFRQSKKWTAPASSFSFTVASNKKLFSQKQLISYGLILCAVCGAIFGAAVTYIKKKNAKQLASQFTDKEFVRLQLESVRAQLNPHFLFNALAGIQNLMNKNEIDNANRYLTKFARLTRNVLEHKELISLTSEKTLLDDYLQMEQLRFGFQYKITASADLDVENIEIPAMLLQPFVENAVKHGIAEKGTAGKIEIDFIQHQNNLVLLVKDNGAGFDTTQNYEGLGLALSKNRVSLLHSIYKETPFILDIQADSNGTSVKITLTHWL